MNLITQLGYLRFTVTDSGAWRSLTSEVLGFDLTDATDAGNFYCRIDERHHRVAVSTGSEDRLSAMGWETGDAQQLEQFCAHLQARGIAWTEASPEEIAARKVQRMVWFLDPYGFRNEAFFGPDILSTRMKPGRPVSGFRTGGQGLGHIVLRVTNPAAGIAFYSDIMQLKVTDMIRYDGEVRATFFRCNTRHHSFAIAKSGEDALPDVSHFLVEMESLEDVGRAYDMCLDRGTPIFLHLGQHTNDRMISFYLYSPSGFRIEYGFGGIQINDDDWSVKVWDAPMVWGHRRALP